MTTALLRSLCRYSKGAHSTQASLQDSMSSKAERRRFMSGKAADVHHKPVLHQQQQKPKRTQTQQGQQIGVAGQPLSRDDFLSMQKEVQQVGKHAVAKDPYVQQFVHMCRHCTYTASCCVVLLPLGCLLGCVTAFHFMCMVC